MSEEYQMTNDRGGYSYQIDGGLVKITCNMNGNLVRAVPVDRIDIEAIPGGFLTMPYQKLTIRD